MNAAAASMLEILEHIERALARGESTIVLDVANPDLGAGRFAGEPLDGGLIHRPFRVWVDLAERFRLRLRTPLALGASLIRLTFDKLVVDSSSPSRHSNIEANIDASIDSNIDVSEKYGARSTFARVRKLEDPRFVVDLIEAFDRVTASLTSVPAGDIRATAPLRVLGLGVNTGDELALILARIPALYDATFVGVDHSASALAAARERFAGHANIAFVEADLATLGTPVGAELGRQLGRFDLVLSIGLLQSRALDDRELLRHIVQSHLTPRGAVILGMPNCRYIDGELEYGARIVNITQPELGLLVKDLAFYRKYLQQHHRKVFVTGKHYVLVTAIAE